MLPEQLIQTVYSKFSGFFIPGPLNALSASIPGISQNIYLIFILVSSVSQIIFREINIKIILRYTANMTAFMIFSACPPFLWALCFCAIPIGFGRKRPGQLPFAFKSAGYPLSRFLARKRPPYSKRVPCPCFWLLLCPALFSLAFSLIPWKPGGLAALFLTPFFASPFLPAICPVNSTRSGIEFAGWPVFETVLEFRRKGGCFWL